MERNDRLDGHSMSGEVHPAVRGQAFDAAERRDILDELARLDDLDPASHPDVHDRVVDVRRRYREAVPLVPLARDPFSGEVLRHSFDPFGLDGLWWDAEGGGRPVLPMSSSAAGDLAAVPPTYFGLRGAVRLAQEVEATRFLAKPGPEVPVVLPRLLRHEGVRAVVAQVTVGRHTGYPIAYFADPQPPGESLPNDWGLDCSQRVSADGGMVWDRAYGDDQAGDPDLEPWIAAGKLLWVAPGDPAWTLRDSVGDCPYLGLAGSPLPARIHYGQVWRD